MRLSWKMGRVAGIDLYIHATFFIVFWFLRNVRPEPVEAMLFICSVFGCVLLHELGHALAARRFGIRTMDITLYPIGGVARLERMPRAPGVELVIALAGPAVNFAIVAAIAGLFFVGSTVFGLSWSFESFLGELMLVNLGLGLFNLVPAFPMDGGRVLRAGLSAVVGRMQATRVASIVGQILAVTFGTVMFLWTGDLIHAALAAFIFFAARTEEAHVCYEERRRVAAQANHQGMWVAPPGYHWVDRGHGFWQLARIGAGYPDPAAQDVSGWR